MLVLDVIVHPAQVVYRATLVRVLLGHRVDGAQHQVLVLVLVDSSLLEHFVHTVVQVALLLRGELPLLALAGPG